MPPTLFLMVGLPGAGKTTVARRLEAEHPALRLTKDEWIKALFGEDNPERASDVIEGRLIEVARRCLTLGTSVVLDFGLWSRDERSALRQLAADVGASAQVVFCAVDPAEQRRRLAQRLIDAPGTTWFVSDDELDTFAEVFQRPSPSEVDGTEPVDPPPPGFATWSAWIAHRWCPVEWAATTEA